MSDNREIIVIADSGFGKISALKVALRDFFRVDNYAMSATTTSNVEDLPKDVILYKAPPIFEESRVIYNPKETPKRKGKAPRKKQNGYF